ncbi:hypothetical protein D7Z96_00075 [Pseudarthrobacter phenanthrenivorans]|jgi:hypothetical protein|uniref:Uncharacterized protein n=2 Tax=Pseudarthrobacter phenanthrenivorans TaxID=361575 RepID=A0A3B0GB28_PSEPS|nr:hypothetical protein [Pseudarthrobacter phenanthrenivorans]ADX73062.1 hypothetical protein Asphe3_19070 [Pseudarthrobacter phenanthrenivorans Sphe3]RKO27377.1 hypothetical protein D7Z96_00075 [Pseudarthrobacter phenanthrenivorans]TPV53317.1 hypothetical protein FJ661_01635 [Pseudarthrobacter phenanthrenivorans]
MPWWSWILIWVALVSLALLFYLLLGIRLFRQFMATVKDLGEAGEKLGRLGPLDAPEDPADPARPVPGSAVFASPSVMRHDYEASKSSRREERRLRRVQRKTDRGQPQALGDLDFT